MATTINNQFLNKPLFLKFLTIKKGVKNTKPAMIAIFLTVCNKKYDMCAKRTLGIAARAKIAREIHATIKIFQFT